MTPTTENVPPILYATRRLGAHTVVSEDLGHG